MLFFLFCFVILKGLKRVVECVYFVVVFAIHLIFFYLFS